MSPVSEARPSEQACRAWVEPVVYPTYPAAPPDKNPMFLEKRVYQGSSGRVYPNPFTDRLTGERVERAYEAVHLENDFIYLQILPEIGGRIHVARDKSNGYDFFYRQQVIKPALVGLLGPWISGGVEFNWPQHHRPSTFMPVEYEIEHEEDGSVTVWLSEHEPMNRMKGMAGIRLRPNSAVIEVRGRLYNRTPFTQTFLWWANVAARVHDHYQSFFPPDVTFVADHAKRAISDFPECRGFYYGVDYRPATRLDWYKNIPVPTSYMVTQSDYDFFGGYDHLAASGFVHVADRNVAPGKKQWTWGNHEFGYAWDRNLTDEDGPYVELMAGVFTDNQPDFSWLAPFETKTFSQYWYPIQGIGPASNANLSAAVSLHADGGRVRVGVAAPVSHTGAILRLARGEEVLRERAIAVGPGAPHLEEFPFTGDPAGLRLSLHASDGREIISYSTDAAVGDTLPQPATEPPLPEAVQTNEELYLTGLHLEQYRHATRYPEDYWREALRRDASDTRCNIAMGHWYLRRGQFTAAEGHYRAAIGRLTRLNPNPATGEAHYGLGLALRYQERSEEAYAAFFKAAWNAAWVAPARFALAEIDAGRSNLGKAFVHLDEALAANARFSGAANLKAALLRRFGRRAQALALVRSVLAGDRLDHWALHEQALLTDNPTAWTQLWKALRGDPNNYLDLAHDYARAGLKDEAVSVLERAIDSGTPAARWPLIPYTLAFLLEGSGNREGAARWRSAARDLPPDYCFPNRLEDIAVLESAIREGNSDPRALYFLGNFLYDRKRREEAITVWEQSVQLDPTFSIPWRNLGVAYFNARRQGRRAMTAYRRAMAADPGDARLLYEFDQLAKRLGESPEGRLRRLERAPKLVCTRDDLYLERVALLNRLMRSGEALELLLSRRFHPWEGGEGRVSSEYVRAHLQLGWEALEAGKAEEALAHFSAGREYPESLGEGKHFLTPETHLELSLGLASEALGAREEARAWWERAAAPREPSEMSYYQLLALERLGERGKAREVLRRLLAFAVARAAEEPRVDYFATSLPDMLIFDDDLVARQTLESTFLEGLARAGLGQKAAAARLFERVLALDPSHAGAAEHLRGGTRPATKAARPNTGASSS